MALRALLFDKDGTLVDFALTWNGAAASVLATLAGDDDGLHTRLAGILHFDRASATIMPTSPFVGSTVDDIAVEFAPALGDDDPESLAVRLSALFNAGALASVAPIGDPHSLLTLLKAEGYLLGIITNDTESGARARPRSWVSIICSMRSSATTPAMVASPILARSMRSWIVSAWPRPRPR